MFEKIYACLLRLYPPAFRRRFGTEALQLVRDRLLDERGLFRRLRLSFDLLLDLIGALPQAYRNSYVEVRAIASATPHFDGIPSFQSLRNEPIRRETFVVAGVLTLTALLILGQVMELPSPFPVAHPNGRKSPIEMVLERLNKPTPSGFAEDASSQPPQSNPAAASRPEIPTNAAHFPATAIAPNPDVHALALGKQNRKPSTSVRGASSIAAASSVPASGGGQPMQNQTGAVQLGQRGAISDVLAYIPASLSGKWTDSLRADGAYADAPRLFTLDQNGSILTGTGGPNSSDQFPIIYGSAAGHFVRFELDHERQIYRYDLTVVGNELRGTLSIRRANETRRVTAWLKRSQ
jgi:hypothetical protein